MHTFLALTRVAIQRQFTYRAATMAGLATNIFFGLLRAAVMVALYGNHKQVNGLSLQDAITFTGLSQASIAFLSLFGWFEIVYSVNSGQVGADLLKPMGYFSFWMAQDLGRALVNLLLRGLTIMVFYALVFDITTPASPGQWMALAMSLTFAWMTSFSWRFLINLSAFWSPNAVGFCRLFFALTWFMSGFFMPLRFFPEWFQRVCYLTPFPQLINTPIEIYLGQLNPTQTAQALSLQVFWIIVLVIAGQLGLIAGVRRLVIQGG
jgi:viologen exporter family transport system permease protein